MAETRNGRRPKRRMTVPTRPDPEPGGGFRFGNLAPATARQLLHVWYARMYKHNLETRGGLRPGRAARNARELLLERGRLPFSRVSRLDGLPDGLPCESAATFLERFLDGLGHRRHRQPPFHSGLPDETAPSSKLLVDWTCRGLVNRDFLVDPLSEPESTGPPKPSRDPRGTMVGNRSVGEAEPVQDEDLQDSLERGEGASEELQIRRAQRPSTQAQFTDLAGPHVALRPRLRPFLPARRAGQRASAVRLGPPDPDIRRRQPQSVRVPFRIFSLEIEPVG